MRVLVTSHQGYLGNMLVPALLERWHDAVGIDSGLVSTYTLSTEPRGIPEIATDVRDEPSQLLRRPKRQSARIEGYGAAATSSSRTSRSDPK